MSLKMLNEKDPEVLKALYAYRREVFKNGSPSVKEKELIALALSSASQCSKCFTYHSEKAKEAGASDKEILEAMEVVAYMVGPSGLIWSDLIDEAVGYFEKE